MIGTALLEIPMIEVVKIYSELVEAYHGVNGFGSDTAEIYYYRLMRYNPAAVNGCGDMQREAVLEVNGNAINALRLIVEMFCEHYRCAVEIDGRKLMDWYYEIMVNPESLHRCHIRIITDVEDGV